MKVYWTASVLALVLVVSVQLSATPVAEKKLRVVVFGAHCDDPETGAGGLVAQLTQAGHEVILAYAATFRGDRKIDGEPEDTVRRRESTAACEILGAKPYFFPYDMATLTNDPATAKQFNDWLASVNPDIVLAHWPLDTHPNHQVVGALAWQAYRHEGGWPLYYFEVLTDTQSMSFRPDVYVDITPVKDIKKKAVDCLVSQDANGLWGLHDAMHLARGKECGCERAEAYFLVEAKPGSALLPVSVKKRLEGIEGMRRQEETLDRGIVAMPMDNNRIYIGWRLFKKDFPGLAFNVYRALGDGPGEKLNEAPIEKTTDFIDAAAPSDKDKSYWIEPLLYKMPQGISKKVTVKAGGAPTSCLSIKLNGDYTFQKVGIGDLDGDGRYDFVIKQPDANVDPGNSYWNRSPGTYIIEAYLQDGTFLWQKDLTWAIEQGTWYSPYVVYDFDGDGKAEVAIKTGEGDTRDADGRVKTGPEYLSILDGMTGQEITRTDWLTRLEVYKLSSRNQLGVAYLDGKTPHIMMARGTYEDMKLAAFRYHDGKLYRVWDWTNAGESPAYWGQGAHFMHCADVDGDGRDEVILGSCAVDDNGKSLWSTGLGHPDHCYVGEIDPAHPGLEIYYGIEGERVLREKDGTCLVDAKTGAMLWGLDEHTWHVHATGLCADIDGRYPGLECYSGEVEMPKDKPHRWLHSASGEILAREDTCNLGLSPRSAYWDADLQKELAIGSRIYKFETGETCFDSLEGNQVAWGDILGDWREEIITCLPGELRVYTTTIPAADRRPCLMQDSLFRQDVAHLSMGYAQPPMLSYWIGSGGEN
ncbi:MAG TPA: PIG-L family deacetylase [Candidatus Hydrogenedentes bacterium]|nr:PIG-L family deacetylase [Candidatus Hydrogenedentota bacterium]